MDFGNAIHFGCLIVLWFRQQKLIELFTVTPDGFFKGCYNVFY